MYIGDCCGTRVVRQDSEWTARMEHESAGRPRRSALATGSHHEVAEGASTGVVAHQGDLRRHGLTLRHNHSESSAQPNERQSKLKGKL